MRRRKGTIFFNDFNSIMVQLRLAVTKNKTFVHPNFNSIKVQLRQERHNIHATSGIFQFHKGTIKTTYRKIYRMRFTYFNSIKVQLRRDDEYYQQSFTIFQFHKGTIKTPLLWDI